MQVVVDIFWSHYPFKTNRRIKGPDHKFDWIGIDSRTMLGALVEMDIGIHLHLVEMPLIWMFPREASNTGRGDVNLLFHRSL